VARLRLPFALPFGLPLWPFWNLATWTAGGGVEYGITDNLSARVEYLYLDKGHIATGVIGPPPTQITTRLQDNFVRAGLNYRFTAW
jgi:outer membrane immunogenic protein